MGLWHASVGNVGQETVDERCCVKFMIACIRSTEVALALI
jgi:hypothetical protein